MTTFQFASGPPMIQCVHCVTAFRPAAELPLHRTILSHLVDHYHTIVTIGCLSECLMHHIVPLRYLTHHHQSITVKLTGFSCQWHKCTLPRLHFYLELTTHKSLKPFEGCVTISFLSVKAKEDSIEEDPSLSLFATVKPVYIHHL